jgi:hypothetical protein
LIDEKPSMEWLQVEHRLLKTAADAFYYTHLKNQHPCWFPGGCILQPVEAIFEMASISF